ncbi:hypothetical protein I4F81_004368 [Pyropia yezoensis]|uniref:Uncharacterized protein n=1 Tax=Pyropia yezoensis TaxID=2788 RepID=A0ACC3BV87_PYRYE|nr:hypothetical protein I4F81_004368 [Neopyropia yezoensis]
MQNQMDVARMEMQFYTDLFNRMVDGCFKKCVPRFHDAELNTGEQVCVDRCIAKYMDAQNKVGEILQSEQQAQMASQGGPSGPS